MCRSGPLTGRKVVIVSAFFESSMPSLREHQYVRALSEAGAEVTLVTSTGSNVWRYNRAGLSPLPPDRDDARRVLEYRFDLVRCRPILRFSDCVIFVPPWRLIRTADVVHVIEFRQGGTLLAALMARLAGKLVIYDHEQRGDRQYTFLHRLDSQLRRLFIFVGALTVNRLRHTVHANLRHFHANSWARPRAELAPLGADERVFYFSATLRQAKRYELGLGDSARLAVFSGKVTAGKRVDAVLHACRRLGWHLGIVGRIDPLVRAALLARDGDENVTIAEWETPEGLNSWYNAADLVIFTTFTVSYWEAALAGAHVLVPRTSFSEAELAGRREFTLFGHSDMFVVEEEQYRSGFDVAGALGAGIETYARQRVDERRVTVSKYSWEFRRMELVKYYARLLSEAT